MPLGLLLGPANAGKVARLLDRYVEAIDQEPFLVVPNRADVDRVERELLVRSPGLLGGSIGTFDDLFARIRDRAGNGDGRAAITDAQRSLLLADVVARAHLNGLTPSSRFPGFAESLGGAVAELESSLVAPENLDDDLGALYGDYRAELERLALWDRELERGYAASLVAGELSAWDDTPV